MFRQLVLRRYGVSEIAGAPGEYRRFTQRRISAHQSLQFLNTSIATSGHITAQVAHPVHSPPSSKEATKYPFKFNVPERKIAFFGQNSMQSAQPLHLSWSILIEPFNMCLGL